MTGHCLVPLKEILVGPTPGMMNSHRIVSRNRTIKERPLRFVSILFDKFLKTGLTFPETENLAFELWEINVSHRLFADLLSEVTASVDHLPGLNKFSFLGLMELVSIVHIT
jgi:membrane glycosyltransferase